MCAKLISLLILGMAALACAFPSDPYHQPKHQSYKSPPKPYSFSYGIKDPYGGNNFGQEETSDGNNVKGSYSVQLSDGRLQTVEYIANHHDGYIAKVSYKGQAKYPSKVGPPFIVAPHKGGGGGGYH